MESTILMNLLRYTTGVAILIAAAAAHSFALDNDISGIAKVKLSGWLTQDQIAQCKADARARFRVHLISWLDEEKNLKIDTTANLTNLLFGTFVDSCLSRTRELPELKGSFWTYAYSIPSDSLFTMMSSYNDRVELLATDSWIRLTNALSRNDYEEIYYQSVEVIARTSEYIGPALKIPGDTTRSLLDTARSALKSFLEKISIASSAQLLSGKPGMPADSPPVMTVTIEGHPFPGLGMTGFIPGGRDIWKGVSDNKGQISFENLIIPFAKNGTLIYVTPNLGRVLDNRWHIGVRDFGIESANDLNQSFFLKINRPSFSLVFDASDPDPADTLPQDFLSGALIKKFLEDSCWLDSSLDSIKADLSISITCRISSANSEALDAGEARFEGSVAILAPHLRPPRSEKEPFYFEKKYDEIPYGAAGRRSLDQHVRMSVPLGVFIWDANVKMHEAVRKVIARL